MTYGGAEDAHGSRLRIALTVYRGNPYCGGQGVYVRHLAAGLTRLGHDVTVFSGQPYPSLDEGIELVKLPGLDLYREPEPFRRVRLREIERPLDMLEVATMWTGGFPEPWTFSLRLRDELRRRRGQFDIVHDDQSLGSALLGIVEDGVPVVASVHHPVTIDRAIDLRAATTASKRMSLRRWYGFSAMQSRVAASLERVLTVSSSAKADIVSEMGVESDRIDVVPVGVDPGIWHPLPGVERIPGRIMTTASSDIPMKGLAFLLEALAKLRTERDDAHLVVVGRLHADSPVAAQIERFAVGDFVEFISGVSDAELVYRYATSDVAVVPSLYEGFSLPAVEAMACGVPLVVTDGGALPEVVGDAAVIVPGGDSAALSQALATLLSDPDERRWLGERGRRRAIGSFSWDRTAAGTAAVYRRVLEGFEC